MKRGARRLRRLPARAVSMLAREYDGLAMAAATRVPGGVALAPMLGAEKPSSNAAGSILHVVSRRW